MPPPAADVFSSSSGEAVKLWGTLVSREERRGEGRGGEERRGEGGGGEGRGGEERVLGLLRKNWRTQNFSAPMKAAVSPSTDEVLLCRSRANCRKFGAKDTETEVFEIAPVSRRVVCSVEGGQNRTLLVVITVLLRTVVKEKPTFCFFSFFFLSLL
ncbi:hypothetical protein EYF80_060679 [Liparis tanakae]|uniref:Uncharacterized protein n=1 Tax=Liparis tanakae TaxID=230148 RepID=A0A4Z2EK38_9TELE|nr:hypothetical protein EYF80_060679 [Liparis tanakae]